MKLESTTDEVLVLPQDTIVYMHGGMALLQWLHEAQYNTFTDIAKLMLRRMAHWLSNMWCWCWIGMMLPTPSSNMSESAVVPLDLPVPAMSSLSIVMYRIIRIFRRILETRLL